ncbi:hypothetical protein CBS101457_005479 [Exobasidium rhododendri]|nr:hypothetical protein CBS101457_005479 [Exobasidium rhododendri]
MKAVPQVELVTIAAAACRPCRRRILQSQRTARTYSSSPAVRSPSSTTTVHSDRLSESISRHSRLPCFTIPSSHVRLLEEPSHFYKELLAVISRAQERIFIASLYVGKTEIELISHLRNALARKPKLQITILVDSLRSTREGEYVGTSKSSSCASLLAGLQVDYPDRFQVRLYRAPDLPSWLEKLVGKRFVEGWGLQHMKIYGGDDEVMISGANLSNDYFTNRRDRYMRFQDSRFSQYMHTLLMIAARYSYRLDAVASSNQEKWELKDSVHAPFQLSWDEGRRLSKSIDPSNHGSKRWKTAMKYEIEKLTNNWYEELQMTSSAPLNDADLGKSIQVVPLLQMGRLGVRQETECVPLVIQRADTPSSRLDFTTGYFSINPRYASLILEGNFKSNIITASPKANGFYGSRGLSGHLPAAYTWLESVFWAAVKRQKRDEDVSVREWFKSGWTYHAKGIWLYPPGTADPTVTLLGSSNFGTRSASLDLECTLLIDASTNPTIQQRLGQEVRELAKDANDVVEDAMFARRERKVHWGVKVSAWCIKKML